jgi:hypothetical protein
MPIAKGGHEKWHVQNADNSCPEDEGERVAVGSVSSSSIGLRQCRAVTAVNKPQWAGLPKDETAYERFEIVHSMATKDLDAACGMFATRSQWMEGGGWATVTACVDDSRAW